LRKAQGHPGISEAPGRNTYNGPKNSKKVHIGTFVPSMKVVVKRINILANICNHTIHLAPPTPTNDLYETFLQERKGNTRN
jgi:hypothetical protein